MGTITTYFKKYLKAKKILHGRTKVQPEHNYSFPTPTSFCCTVCHQWAFFSHLHMRKEIVKNKAELDEMKMKKIIAKINETKTWFFENLNIDKPLARLKKI